jgi:molybdopterin synthase catalytic subunit
MEHVRTGLQEEDFDIGREIERAKKFSRRTGGVTLFLGVARDFSQDRDVVKLEFDAYREMAGRELEEMAGEAAERFGLLALTILHRWGTIHPGENIVLIIAAAGHREESFTAARWCIDELKKRVPIWKKEFFTDGEIWVQESP